MKILQLFSLLICCSFLGQAQEIERQVISSAAAYFESGNVSLDMTMGEVVTTTVTNPSNLEINQGFHQVDLMVITATHQPAFEFDFDIFPNPTADIVYITTSYEAPLMAALYDLQGRKLLQQELAFPIHRAPIALQELASAQYFLHFTNEKGQTIHAFTIQKK